MKRWIKTTTEVKAAITFDDNELYEKYFKDMDSNTEQKVYRFIEKILDSEDAPYGFSVAKSLNALSEESKQAVVDVLNDPSILNKNKLKKKKAAGQPIQLEVMLDPYSRYERTATRKFKVKGTDLVDALKKICDKALLYLEPEQIDEEGMTPNEIIDEIYSSNGDGCDFIMYIKNLTTGEMLLQENYDPDMEDDI